MHYFKTLTCLAIVCGFHASAATIEVGTARGVGTTETASTSSGQTTVSVSEEFVGGSTSNNRRVVANGLASVDSGSGELKARVEKFEDINFFGDSVSSTAASEETVTLTGSGTVTFNLAYSGFWEVNPGPNFNIFTSLSILDGLLLRERDLDAISNLSNPIAGAVSDNLSVSATVDGIDTFNLKTSLSLIFGKGTGIIDFSNTAFLSFETTGNLAVSFADPNFLSGVTGEPNDPVAPSVPLPAGLPLAVTAFGFLGILRRRRSGSLG